MPRNGHVWRRKGTLARFPKRHCGRVHGYVQVWRVHTGESVLRRLLAVRKPGPVARRARQPQATLLVNKDARKFYLRTKHRGSDVYRTLDHRALRALPNALEETSQLSANFPGSFKRQPQRELSNRSS